LSSLINEAIAQVQAVAIIYGLQGRPGVVRVELSDLLMEVVSGIGQLMHSGINFQVEEPSVGCKVVVSELEAVPIALVLNEIVFNAIKHGSPGSTPSIAMKIDIARERVLLTIANGGILPDRGPGWASGCGSGLQLIHSLLPRRGARFDLTNRPAGVEARLTLEPPIVTLKF
jgi:two-component sensor histidine kinase